MFSRLELRGDIKAVVLVVWPQALGFQLVSRRPDTMQVTEQGKNVLGRVTAHSNVEVGMDEDVQEQCTDS